MVGKSHTALCNGEHCHTLSVYRHRGKREQPMKALSVPGNLSANMAPHLGHRRCCLSVSTWVRWSAEVVSLLRIVNC